MSDETSPEAVQTRYRLSVTHDEAQRLYRIFQEHGLATRYVTTGSRAVLGGGLWGVMKAHGLLSSTGTGRGTTVIVHYPAFDAVEFCVVKRRRPRENRWEEVLVEKRRWRVAGEWLAELEVACGIALPVGFSSDPSPSSPQPLPPEERGKRVEKHEEAVPDLRHVEEVLASALDVARRFKSDLEEELRPRLEKLELTRKEIERLERDLAELCHAKEALANK